jgi:hypothetical protein
MRRAGKSAYSILNPEYGYRGARAAVLAAVHADIQTAFTTLEQSA